ncbi:type II secretion system protein, partial [bacterium]|nr:type II secretion system protein [bacterium]
MKQIEQGEAGAKSANRRDLAIALQLRRGTKSLRSMGEAVKKTAKCSILTFLGGAIQCNHLIIPNGLPRPKGLAVTKSTFNSISRHCEDLTKESIVIKAKSLQIDSSVVSLPQNDKPKHDCTTRHAEFISASYKVGKRKISYATPQTLKQVQGDRYKAAFSLVEILVALIVVSLITAALAPVITKKLSSAGITIVGGGSGGGLNNENTNVPIEDCTVEYNGTYTESMEADDTRKFILKSSGTFKIDCNAKAKIFLVGGGGGGGGGSTANQGGGYGGAGGGITETSLNITANENIDVVVGAGGSRGTGNAGGCSNGGGAGGTTKFKDR